MIPFIRRPAKIGVAILCLVGLAALLGALTRDRGQPLEFEILDYETGKPVSGATVLFCRTWTRLPVEKIPLLGIKQRYCRAVPTKNGVVRFARLRKLELESLIWIEAPRYEPAHIKNQPPGECENPEIYRITYSSGADGLHDSPYEYVDRRKPFTVALEPMNAGVGRLGARYPERPSEGSKERALAAVRRRVNADPDQVEFRNGHWEIKVWANNTRYDVSEAGEILGVHGDG